MTHTKKSAKTCNCGSLPAPVPSVKPNVEDLQECLAGYMALAAIGGAYMPDDAAAWISSKLQGKQRSPMQIWNEMFGDPPSPTLPTILQDIQDRLSAAEQLLSAVEINTRGTCYTRQDLWRLLNECHNLIALARQRKD